MNKNIKIFFIIILTFFIGIFVGYENPEIIVKIKKTYNFFFQPQNQIFIKTISEDIDKKNKTINANSYDLNVEKVSSFGNRASALFFDKKNFKIIREDGKIETKDEIIDFKKTFNFFEKKNGGIKSSFMINNQIFLYQSNYSINCYYASIVKLNTRDEIFKTDCLPDQDNIDFNGLGGGYAIKDDLIYFSIGTPTHQSNEIDNLSQNLNSLYGKIIKIKISELLKDKKIEYQTISLGHRNPQGIVEINEKLYSVEHGPLGGDEINLIEEGKNYGWPIYSMGSDYTRNKKYKNFSKDSKFKNSLFSFLPAIAPSDIATCPSKLKNYYEDFDCLIVLTLRGMSIFVILLDKNSNKVQSYEQILLEERLRKFGRDLKMKLYEDEENYFYLVTDQNNLYKLRFTNFINDK